MPIVDELQYLGVVLSYSGYEHSTVQHRLGKAQQRFGQLSKVLRTRSSFGSSSRLRVYRACIWSSIRYGLAAVGLTQAAYNQVVSTLCVHLRKVLRIYVRGVSNQEVLRRAGIDPYAELLQASELMQGRLARDDRSEEAKAGENDQLLSNLQRLRGIDQAQHGSSLIEIESTPGRGHSCDVCGLSFASAEGLAMHVKHRRTVTQGSRSIEETMPCTVCQFVDSVGAACMTGVRCANTWPVGCAADLSGEWPMGKHWRRCGAWCCSRSRRIPRHRHVVWRRRTLVICSRCCRNPSRRC